MGTDRRALRELTDDEKRFLAAGDLRLDLHRARGRFWALELELMLDKAALPFHRRRAILRSKGIGYQGQIREIDALASAYRWTASNLEDRARDRGIFS